MKTVTIPVIRKAHHAQLLATPFSRTRPVTKLGVSAEKVVATIETPSNHQGMVRPPKKYSLIFLPAVLDAHHQPILSNIPKKKDNPPIDGRKYHVILIKCLIVSEYGML